ncbi:type I-E CRISPR-associated protein Cas6/Cse3/CasE [Streptomyces sp. NBC_00536]|uniref:type I-E CRISPR-associated protein Cas6/Cse3/CasE n=1 Tax=Streptomyces sp. NBC_00536 TaxID=2975769 RepID=UPI003FCD90EB
MPQPRPLGRESVVCEFTHRTRKELGIAAVCSLQSLRHSLVRYDGTATGTDPQALMAAVLSGIGRGKPYGAGLLTLVPAAAA